MFGQKLLEGSWLGSDLWEGLSEHRWLAQELVESGLELLLLDNFWGLDWLLLLELLGQELLELFLELVLLNLFSSKDWLLGLHDGGKDLMGSVLGNNSGLWVLVDGEELLVSEEGCLVLVENDHVCGTYCDHEEN